MAAYPQASATTPLPPRLAAIVTAFAAVADPKLKYAQLLAYGKALPPLPAGVATPETKVAGCVSQVWVVPVLAAGGTLTWLADSDSALTKGLAALLVKGLTGATPEDVVRLSPDWIADMGLSQSLTPSRNNGFLNMFLTMQRLSLGLLSETSGEPGAGAAPADDPAKPVAAAIRAKLAAALAPGSTVVVHDESASHAGHAGARATASPSGETHFRVAIVSPSFAGLKTVARHRLVYSALAEELAGPVHALSLETAAPGE